MDEETIKQDFINARELSTNTIIFVNNVVKTPEFVKYWNTNFNKVYEKFIDDGEIIELKAFEEESVGIGGVFAKFTNDL
jgi:hypothetical protein